MFRLRSKSGDESVFRSPEEIRSALISGFVTPDAQIWDPELKGWVPLLEHALYQQIAAAPGGRKSGVVKGPPSGSTKSVPPGTPSASGGPPGPKPVPKLVIKRPGEGTTAIPVAKSPAPPPPPTPSRTVAPDEFPDLDLIDIDLTPEPITPTPPAVEPPVATPPVPPPPLRTPEPMAPRLSTPRLSSSRMPEPVDARMEPTSASRKGWIFGAVVVLAAAGGTFAFLRGRPEASVVPVDSVTVTAPTAVMDTTRPDSATASDASNADTTKHDSALVESPVAVASPTPRPVMAPAAAPTSDPGPAAPGTTPVAFAPVMARGPTPWNARPVVGAPLTIPNLEVVRLRYLAAQSRALAQFEAGLESAGFTDMFNPARVSTSDRREESLDAADAGRSALREFRRRQTAIDFAYTDSMRQALPAGSDTPDFRTFGPILRENPTQATLTDSLIGEVAEIYGMLVGETGNYTFRGGMLTWKDADNGERYQTLQERLTAQLARIRNRSPADVPPGMAAVLRGIGLPR